MHSLGIHINGLSKKFGSTSALHDLNTHIPAGCITGLVGPDGAGKTTLLRILAGLMKPSKGTITVFDTNVVSEPDKLQGFTGYMPQRFGLYEDLTVIENMQLYADLRGLSPADHKQTFDQLLTFTKLGEFTARLAGNLSGGMKQKLGLACALMGRPQLMLLDEPSVGVDPLSRQDLWTIVKQLAQDGMMIMWSTAYLDEADRCDHVLLLDKGQLIYTGAPQDLTARLAGRSFLLTNLATDRRETLTRATTLPCIRDGTIQGSALRLIIAKDASKTILKNFAEDEGGDLKQVAPRFEDAFMDLLGGVNLSPFADSMPAVEMDSAFPVKVKGLTKRFGDFTATNQVSFDVKRGEVFGLLGPNGAGKSTTFKMLCGLLTPTAGEATIAGLNLRRHASQVKSRLGYMAQKFSLYSLLSVQQNLRFFSGAYGLRGREQKERIREMVEIFELGPLLHHAPTQLSLGYKQRLALACACMHRPSILFLDEPTSGVDPLTRREFWRHITGLVKKGVTVLVTTHFMDEAEFCDRVALIHRANLVHLDTPDALKAKAANAEVPHPSMEQAFIRLVQNQDHEHSLPR